VLSNIRVSVDRRQRVGLAWLATLALIGSLVVGLVLPSTAAAGFSDPTIVEVPNTGFAISDAGMECNVGPSDLTDSSTCPVLQWNGYTYWPMSYFDNRFAFALVAFDELGNQAARWELSGTRYVVDMTVDTTAGTLTIFGQLNFGVDSVVVNLSDIYLAPLAPSITAPANVTVPNDPNQAGAVVNYAAPATTGDVGTVTCTPDSGSFFPIGTTTVTCSTSNTALTASFTVTVNDTQPPSITPPANITVSNDPDQAGAVVNYPSPTASDNAPGVTTNCNPASGSFFPLGTTTVTCTATDASDNTASASFTVTVNDTQPPAITPPANVTVSNDPNQAGAVVNYPAPTVSDNAPNVGTPSCSPASGSFFPLGTTTVNCSVSDASNNTAADSFTVTVNDTEPPAITAPANITVSNDPNQAGAVVNYSAPTVSDNAPGVGSPTCSPPSGSFFPIGTTTVTCTVSDAAGIPASASFTVTVSDTQPPSITTPANITVNASSPAGAVVTYPLPTGSDNAPGTTVTCTPPSGSTFAVGTTTVTCTATDATGNPATTSFTVTVIGAGELLNELRADTVDLVGNSTAERALVATIDQARAAQASGNTWGIYSAMLKYVVQLDMYEARGMVSTGTAHSLATLARQALDAAM
jgi:hypothetical protein